MRWLNIIAALLNKCVVFLIILLSSHSVMDFSKNIPKYLVEKGNLIKQVLFTALFSLFFINMFEPYGSRDWLNGGISEERYFLLSSLLVLIGMLVVTVSRLLLYHHCVSLRRPIQLWAYLFWIGVEIVCIAFCFAILEIFMFHDPRPIGLLLRKSFANTACILLLPYTVTWLFFSWRDKDHRLQAINEYRAGHQTLVGELREPTMVNFYDQKGDIKLVVAIKDLLYIKGADNYLSIHYLDGNKIGSSLIRGSFKNIEDDMKQKGIIRCHRSYMVNRLHVRVFEKARDGFVVRLDTSTPIEIPVSRNYSQDVFELFDNK